MQGAHAGIIAELRSRSGEMRSDYSDRISRVEYGMEGEADRIQD